MPAFADCVLGGLVILLALWPYRRPPAARRRRLTAPPVRSAATKPITPGRTSTTPGDARWSLQRQFSVARSARRRACATCRTSMSSWSGAHPTGSIQTDYNSGTADQQEYPVVVLECRGVDPDLEHRETCWTHGDGRALSEHQLHRLRPVAPGCLRGLGRHESAVVGRPADVPAACDSDVPRPTSTGCRSSPRTAPVYRLRTERLRRNAAGGLHPGHHVEPVVPA